MKKGRQNPFEGIDKSQVVKGKDKIPAVGSYKLDLTGRVAGGAEFDFTKFSDRPLLARNLILALDSLIEVSVDIKDASIVSSTRNSFKTLWQFLGQHSDIAVCSLNDTRELTPEICKDYRSWLYDKSRCYSPGYSRRLWQSFSRLIRHMRDSESYLSTLIPKDIEVPSKGLRKSSEGESSVEPYGRGEILQIERCCRKAIWSCVARIKKGKDQADQGADPRLECAKLGCNAPSWRRKENILWYVKHVLDQRFIGSTALRKEHGQFRNATAMSKKVEGLRPLSTRQAYESLLPSTYDLIPFMIMLMIRTGLNFESVISLTRDCLVGKGVTKNTERVRYKKGRGSYEELERPFDNKGQFSPIGLIKTVMLLTAPLVGQVEEHEKGQLFIGLNFANKGKRVKAFGLDKEAKTQKKRMDQDGYVADMCNRTDKRRGLGVFVTWGLLDIDGRGIKYDSRRFRKSYMGKRYEAVGSLAHVSRRDAKHHGKGGLNTTAKHYLNNEANLHLHESAIADGQQALLDEALQGKVVIDKPNDDAKNDNTLERIMNELGESEEFVRDLLNGKQDVFIAQCRNFYDSPYTKKGEPCGEPWMCFECKNAIWTSRILPRLLKFLDFLEEQRQILSAVDWHAKFHKPWSSIKYGIMPRFDEERIEASRLLAEAEQLYVPLHWKTT